MPPLSYSNIIQVKINGMELRKTIAPLLVEGWVDQGVGVPAAFRLTFRDPNRTLLKRLGVTFGTKVVLTPVANGKGISDPLLTGEVTALEADYDGTGSFTVIRGYDLGHRLLRQRRVAAYTNQTASSIVRKLVGLNGVPVGRIESTKTPYEFISQGNVTDWDFIARLADENEMVMSLDAKGKFNFVSPTPSSGAPSPQTDPDKTPFVLQARHDILRLRTAVTASDQVAKVESRGWDVNLAKEIVATAPAITNPGFDIGTTPGGAARFFKPAKLVETATPYDKQAEVKYAANALADDVTSAFAELEVAVRGNPKLRPGVPVALAETGPPFEGKYTVTSVRHSFGDGQHYESALTVSGRQWRSLYGLASGGTGTAPRLPSVANAVVTDVTDPLKRGRVKLKFPWLDDTYVSDWTRSVQLGGKGGGGFFPMDVGDEVLVAFDRGALDHPFVIGGLYNGRDKETKNDVQLYSGARNQASRHTISDRTGNRVDLLSAKLARKQGVRIKSGDDKLTINLDRAQTEISIDSKGTVKITGSRSVSVQAGTSLSLSAGRSLTIKSGGPISIQGGSMINMRSAGQIGVNAGGALNMVAGGAATLTGGGATSITGGGTLQLNSASTRVVGASFSVLAPSFKVITIPVPGAS
ncbi:VgrG-related protein [Streptomyces griseoviridis]|jgi:phage protein D|uniref:Phage protein D n=3 Tax=Streptomyces TaxID=1883 RepID=A0ABT9LFW8_STRGD|nr:MULTISPECIES: VgrG-related protein [Streptomyces]MDP9682613.1 phage protein D [Streptomyces griseoviridis]